MCIYAMFLSCVCVQDQWKGHIWVRLGTFGCGMLQDKCRVGQSYKIHAC